MKPTLIVTIDTEEEFEWGSSFSSESRSVGHLAELPRLQGLFDELGVRPTYVVDHPVATNDEGVAVLREILDRDACEIGAHLHPWVNPPFKEEITPRNSYLSNLPLSLQQEKVEVLTETIAAAFGRRPTSFKAGRYGFDFRLVPRLTELGYVADSSVLPYHDLSPEGGPDFRDFESSPFWLGPPWLPASAGARPMLEVPCMVGFNRRPFLRWSRLHRGLSRRPYRRLRLVGLLWHLHVLRKIWLTPEGTDLPDQLELLELVGRERGCVFNLTFHSSSIRPGCTPFVKDRRELESFLDRLRKTLEFASHRLGARSMTLSELAESWRRFPEAGRPAKQADMASVPGRNG